MTARVHWDRTPQEDILWRRWWRCKKRATARAVPSMDTRWFESFYAFYEDVKGLPNACNKGFCTDRIDNNKGYEPGNVRFVPNRINARNKKNTRYVNLKNGKKLSVMSFIEKYYGFKTQDENVNLYQFVRNWSRKGLGGEAIARKIVKQYNMKPIKR